MNNTKSRPSPLMLAMALSVSALAYPALSHAATEAAKPLTATVAGRVAQAVPAAGARAKSQVASDLKLSQEGYQTMRDIRLARISIFNGDTKAVDELLTQATRELDAVDKTAVKQTADVRTDLLPIDGQIVFADNYVNSPTRRTHIGKANEHLKQGRASLARDELKLAEVDASFSRMLMPIDATRRQLNAAAALVRSNQYDEANLALKAAEDGLLVDTVAISEAPAAGPVKQ